MTKKELIQKTIVLLEKDIRKYEGIKKRAKDEEVKKGYQRKIDELKSDIEKYKAYLKTL